MHGFLSKEPELAFFVTVKREPQPTFSFMNVNAHERISVSFLTSGSLALGGVRKVEPGKKSERL